MTSRLGQSILTVFGLLPCTSAAIWPGSYIDLKQISPVAQEYCHIVRFPGAWRVQHDYPLTWGLDYDHTDYEFRMEGLLGTRFLVGVFINEVGRHRLDATKRYWIDLSDPKVPLLRAKRADWDAASVVPLVRKSIFEPVPPHPDVATFNGLRFAKTGARFPLSLKASRLSPDSAWLVLQSMTAVKAPILDTYQVFFDVFNADTGRKVFTLEGSFTGIGDDPSICLGMAGWLTERYFIIPLGKHRERCIVCDFAPRRPAGAKP